MAKFIFEMPPELAARVEAYRGDNRLKFTADAVRQLIERGLDGGSPDGTAKPAPKPPSFSHGRSKTVLVPKAITRSANITQHQADAAVRATVVALDLPLGNTRKALQKGAKR